MGILQQLTAVSSGSQLDAYFIVDIPSLSGVASLCAALSVLSVEV
jgi:hypothetical protein